MSALKDFLEGLRPTPRTWPQFMAEVAPLLDPLLMPWLDAMQERGMDPPAARIEPGGYWVDLSVRTTQEAITFLSYDPSVRSPDVVIVASDVDDYDDEEPPGRGGFYGFGVAPHWRGWDGRHGRDEWEREDGHAVVMMHGMPDPEVLAALREADQDDWPRWSARWDSRGRE